MTKKIVNEVKSEINTLEAQGAKLGLKWKAIQRSDRKQITDFDLPLGKLMLAESIILTAAAAMMQSIWRQIGMNCHLW